jgi:hypothetical protein
MPVIYTPKKMEVRYNSIFHSVSGVMTSKLVFHVCPDMSGFYCDISPAIRRVRKRMCNIAKCKCYYMLYIKNDGVAYDQDQFLNNLVNVDLNGNIKVR